MSHTYSIFRLPAELLSTLAPRNLLNQALPEPTPEPSSSSLASTAAISSLQTNSCNICTATFSSLALQRSHCKSDWHRYNVKTRLAGGEAVDEAKFSALIGELEDSISGSESSSEEEDSDEVSALVKKQKQSPDDDDYEIVGKHRQAQTALAWFHSPPSTQIGIYKAVFPSPSEPDYLSQLKHIQLGPDVEDGRLWTVFMVAGGHFAGAVVRFNPPQSNTPQEGRKQKLQKPVPEMTVILHKTFHRYTTRRKQGGSQSLNDNAKGNAKSAGAQLRRYGEQALRDDIRGLMTDWEQEIGLSERVFIRANTTARRIFLDWKQSPFEKKDERLRTFPFPTRRPTQAELLRCVNELCKAKVSHLSEDTLRARDEAYLASLPKPKPAPAPMIPTAISPVVAAPKLTKEDELLRERWDRLLSMVTKGRIEPLKAFWEKYGDALGGVDAAVPEWATVDSKERGKGDTLLQIASSCDQEEVVKWLLEDAKADPTIFFTLPDAPDSDTDSKHRTAYDLATSRPVRDTFRRVAGAHPDWWDWFGKGRIPSALSKEMEDDREEKKKIRRKGVKERLKERKEKEGSTPDPEQVQVPSAKASQAKDGPQRLGGSSGAMDAVMGLAPEMRAKIERERRARAAEARLAALSK